MYRAIPILLVLQYFYLITVYLPRIRYFLRLVTSAPEPAGPQTGSLVECAETLNENEMWANFLQ